MCMAKIKLPQWISEVWGKVDKNNIVFRRAKKTIILESDPSPSYTRTKEQDNVRRAYKYALKDWKALDSTQKAYYNKIASHYNLSGYNYFMKYKIPHYILPPFVYEITINNTQNNNTLSNYQILLNVSNDSLFFNTIQDKKFMEFYDSDQETLLNHFTELWDATNYNAGIWIKVPQIQASSSKKIYLKCNTNRTVDLSDPNNVFDFFDDFNTGTLDSNKWEVVSGSWSIENYELHTNSGTGSYIRIKNFTFTNHEIIVKIKWLGGGFFETAPFVRAVYGNEQQNRLFHDFTSYYAFAPQRLFEIYNGSTVNLTQYGNVRPSTDTWYTFYTKAVGNVLYGKILPPYPNYLTQNIVYLTSGVCGLMVHSQGTVHAHFDDIKIRKATVPEPTISYTKIA